MPTKKKLKQQIRARMARTGESYTSARRHVAPESTSPPEDLPTDERLAAAALVEGVRIGLRLVAHYARATASEYVLAGEEIAPGRPSFEARATGATRLAIDLEQISLDDDLASLASPAAGTSEFIRGLAGALEFAVEHIARREDEYSRAGDGEHAHGVHAVMTALNGARGSVARGLPPGAFHRHADSRLTYPLDPELERQLVKHFGAVKVTGPWKH